MVLRCLDDYLAGHRYPLDALTYLEPRPPDSTRPTFSLARSPRRRRSGLLLEFRHVRKPH